VVEWRIQQSTAIRKSMNGIVVEGRHRHDRHHGLRAARAGPTFVFVELPKAGAKLAAGKIFGSVESVKAVSEIFAAGERGPC